MSDGYTRRKDRRRHFKNYKNPELTLCNIPIESMQNEYVSTIPCKHCIRILNKNKGVK